MVSRADLIAELKSHNIRGSLSKMNRSKLLELRDGLDEAVLDEGASLQPMSGATPSRPSLGGGGISLAPMMSDQKYEINPKRMRALTGTGHSYRDFVRDNLSKYGGMKETAAAYREQKGSGANAHSKFMKDTHRYCDEQKGSGYMKTNSQPPIESMMRGGAYWSTHHFQKGAGWLGDLGHAAVDGLSIAAEGATDAVGAVAATAIGNPELTPFIAAGADELRREGANYLHDKIDGR